MGVFMLAGPENSPTRRPLKTPSAFQTRRVFFFFLLPGRGKADTAFSSRRLFLVLRVGFSPPAGNLAAHRLFEPSPLFKVQRK